MDPAAYGGEPGLSTAHYLIKLVHDILEGLDTNSKGNITAAIATFYDWSKAYDMQCHKLGVESFIECGVRASILPILVSYLQDRTMIVKYKSAISTERELPGGGAQGTLIGPIEYACQSNKSANVVDPSRRYKFVDDLTTLEIAMLASKVLSYNFHNHVASDIGTENKFIEGQDLKTAVTAQHIYENQKMALNSKKTKYMIINYTKDFQFNTRLFIENTLLDCISQIRLLGVELTSDLSWKTNTESIVKKSFARMSLIRKLVGFGVKENDLKDICIAYIRSKLEYCPPLWHSTITEEQNHDLERVQKCALRTILQERYISYENALEVLDMDKLDVRREQICTSFALKSIKHPQLKTWFPRNDVNLHNIRDREPYHVTHACNERFKNSTIPYLQRLLNNLNAN